MYTYTFLFHISYVINWVKVLEFSPFLKIAMEDFLYNPQSVNVAKCIRSPLDHGDVYLFGKSQMEDLLNMYGLMDVISPTEVVPARRLEDQHSLPEVWGMVAVQLVGHAGNQIFNQKPHLPATPSRFVINFEKQRKLTISHDRLSAPYYLINW